jgi:hypothetical protein
MTDDRYPAAVGEMLQRIGDLLEDLVRLKEAELDHFGVSELPARIRRRLQKIESGGEPAGRSGADAKEETLAVAQEEDHGVRLRSG